MLVGPGIGDDPLLLTIIMSDEYYMVITWQSHNIHADDIIM